MRLSTKIALFLVCTIIAFGFVAVPTVSIAPDDKNNEAVMVQETLDVYYPMPPVATSETTKEPVQELKQWTAEEATALAKMLWGEARGISSDTEKAACIWCVLNRVDSGQGTIIDVVTAPYQFVGYQESNPVDVDLYALCEDVLSRWYREKDGETDVGRVLPSEYLFFTGDGQHNYFRNAYKNGMVWTWGYKTPYKN